MKNLVLSKPIDTVKKFYVVQEATDKDEYAMEYYDKKLNITLKILPDIKKTDPIDGGSIPDMFHSVLAPLQDKTAHGFALHDKIWSHRLLLKELYEDIGMTFKETNRIMGDVHTLAKCSGFEKITTKIGLKIGGRKVWNSPDEKTRNLKDVTVVIEIGDTRMKTKGVSK